jgi:tetratricopeptide (TPR) repeat protein
VKRSIVILVSIISLTASIAIVSSTRTSLTLRGRLQSARDALQSRDYAHAQTQLQEAVRIDPTNGETHLLIARVNRHLGKLDEARTSLQMALQYGAEEARVRREEWLTLAQGGQMLEAMPHLAELLVAPGEDGPEICEAYAVGLIRVYRLSEGIEILRAWEKDYPNDPQPHFFFAKILKVQTGVTSTVIERLEKALRLAPNRDDIRRELALSLIELRNYDTAREHLARHLAANPGDIEAQVGWCRLLIENGDIEEAKSRLETLVRSNRENFAALLALGQIELSAGRPRNALSWFERALRLRPFDVELRYALANAFQATGATEAAKTHFDYVVNARNAHRRIEQLIAKVLANNTDLDARFEIADLLGKYGDPMEQRQWLQSILALDPSNDRAQSALANYRD